MRPDRAMVVNGLSVDIEDWFQVGAFEKTIRRDEWEFEADLPTTRPGRIVADLLAGGYDEQWVVGVAQDALRWWHLLEGELAAVLAPFAERYGGPPGDGEWLLHRLLVERAG